MSRFAGIARAMEASFYQNAEESSKSVSYLIFKNTFQKLAFHVSLFLAKYFAIGKKNLLEKQAAYFSIISEYQVRIIQSIDDIYHHFMQWEYHNNESGSWRQREDSRNEKEAWERYAQLSDEVRKRLSEQDFPFRLDFKTAELIRSWDGHISISPALAYWKGLEKFISNNVAYLKGEK